VQAAAASAAESGEQIVQSATGAAGTPAPAVVEEQPALPPPPKKKAKVAAPEPDTEAIVSAPETPAPAVENGAVQTGALSPPDPAQAAGNEPLPLPPSPQLPAAAPQPAPAQQGGLTGLISQIGSQFGAGGSDTAAAPAENQPRKRSIRDDDPLEGTRVPLNATGVAQVPAQQPQEQQVALNLPPAPDQAAPQAAPEAQESLDAGQAFAPQAPAPAPAPAQQQGGFLQNLQRNLGLGTGTRQPATVVTGGQQAANQQVAALPPAAATAPAPAIPAGGGFQVQLASFTSQGEAESEFQRLKQRHPGLLGSLQPRIQPADLGSLGTRYRLGVAPLGSREQAAKLCNSLIAAGVRDCTVRAF
jgi:hypothetical protein